MRVATTIFTFGGGKKITERHLPLWKDQTDDLLLVFPYDDPCVIPDTDMIAHEVSNKYGMPCLRRQLFGMKTALHRYEADYYVFSEYDGFLLRRPEPRIGIQANVFLTSEADYSSNRFFHFPWVFDRKTLEYFVSKATFEPFEKGFVDRWLSAQVDQLSGIEVFDLQAAGEGISRNTIDERTIGGEIEELVANGVYAIHGIKAPHYLKAVMNAAKLRL